MDAGRWDQVWVRHRRVAVSPEFQAAVAWHRAGKAGSPEAPSVKHTAAILAELDRALIIMALVPGSSQPVRDFLSIHAEAPYNRG